MIVWKRRAAELRDAVLYIIRKCLPAHEQRRKQNNIIIILRSRNRTERDDEKKKRNKINTEHVTKCYDNIRAALLIPSFRSTRTHTHTHTVLYEISFQVLQKCPRFPNLRVAAYLNIR